MRRPRAGHLANLLRRAQAIERNVTSFRQDLEGLATSVEQEESEVARRIEERGRLAREREQREREEAGER